MLKVIYSSKCADRGTISYLNAIQQHIMNTKIINTDRYDYEEVTTMLLKNNEQIIALRPLPRNIEKLITNYLERFKGYDIEGVSNYNSMNYTLTAEAIADELKDVEGKRVLIINRSAIVGIPLMQLLVRRGATVTIAHTKTNNLKELILNTDILVTATHNPKFKIDNELLTGVEEIIDLSEDTDRADAVRRIKTVPILKERLHGIDR